VSVQSVPCLGSTVSVQSVPCLGSTVSVQCSLSGSYCECTVFPFWVVL
jgi:hypothetical protein